MDQKKIFIIGIEGAGTSALAMMYKKMGHDVTGSDDGDGFYRAVLINAGISVFEGFSEENITAEYDFYVHSTAFDESNIEVKKCQQEGHTIMNYPQAIGKLTEEFYTIAVCGTHGKTTTTGYTTSALVGAGRDVSAIIGAPVVGWKGGARVGAGKEFVLEADEYQNKLALYKSQAVIVTSIDYDHPDFFPDLESYKKVYIDFIMRIPRTGFLVIHYPDWKLLDIAKDVQCQVITYGDVGQADAILAERKVTKNHQEISFHYKEENHTFSTRLPGKHNALNALAAWLLARSISGNNSGVADGIKAYKGVARRFEAKGHINGAASIDDYAHHPEEIRMTLATVRELYPQKKLIAAFHPHTFTRTKKLLDEFARTLDIADEVVILDIYGSARECHGGVHATDLVDAINQGVTKKARHIEQIEELATWAMKNLTQDDVFITLGAGDIYKVHDEIQKNISTND